MPFFTWLMDALAGLFGRHQGVRGHHKNQAYGPRWSEHRPRRINQYHRRRPRSAR
jgi:hypothetical protein